MKPLMILFALLCVGCEPPQTKQDATKRDASHDWPNRNIHIVSVRRCEYVLYENGYLERPSIAHAGDCPNPKHGEGR